MKIVEKRLDLEPAYDFSNIKKEKIVFFDIETTGLSAHKSVLYLIGVIYYEDNTWKLVQWFADDSEDEEKIIIEFFNIISTRNYLVNYNGNGFDIPYIKKKIEQLGLNYSFNMIESIDLYKICKKYKDILKIEDCKLKTLERYFGISREDRFSGKELIDTYKEYIKIYSLEKLKKDNVSNQYEKSNPLLKELLLHNEEDIINLLEVTRICYIDDIFNENIVYNGYLIEDKEIIIKYYIDYKDNLCQKNRVVLTDFSSNVLVTIENNIITLHIKIYEGILKFFYSNYKDYYYLPKEDSAIHKSVAMYVDKEYREPAKKSNCYTKKIGKYVIGVDDFITPTFKHQHSDKEKYIALDDLIKNDVDMYGKKIISKVHG